MGQAATLAVTLTSDGTPIDASGSVLVTITRDDGTAVVTAQTAVHGVTGVYTFTLTAAQNMQLDRLTCVWSGTIAGQANVWTTRVQVAGGVSFSVAQARKLRPLDDATTYPAGDIVAYREGAEEALEDVTWGAFVPRYQRATYSLRRGRATLLPNVRAVRSVKLDGTLLTSDEYDWTTTGLLTVHAQSWNAPWDWTMHQVEVCYEHGLDETPWRVSRALMLLTRRWLVESPFDERTTKVQMIRIGQLDLQGEGFGIPFDIPELNVICDQYGFANQLVG